MDENLINTFQKSVNDEIRLLMELLAQRKKFLSVPKNHPLYKELRKKLIEEIRKVYHEFAKHLHADLSFFVEKVA